MVVTPSVVIEIVADVPDTVVVPVCAPLNVTLICWTPLPPGLSTALSVIVTLELFHPLAFGAGNAVSVVVGGKESPVAVAWASLDWQVSIFEPFTSRTT